MKNREIPTIFAALKQVYVFYYRHGYRIVGMRADGEFAPLLPSIGEMTGAPTINLTSAGEHVPEIERRIRVIKERCRAMRHGLPYNRVPKLLLTNLVLACGRMLNNFPSKGGVSSIYSPRTILTGESLDYKKDLALEFGQYCQVHEEDKPRNGQAPCMRAAICMGPSGNKQGGFYFMSLRSCKRITRYAWDELPMPDTVIDRINELGKGQPELLTFTDRKGRLIGDGDVELTGVDGEDNEALQDTDEAVEDDLDDSVNEIVAEADELAAEEEAEAAEQPRIQDLELDAAEPSGDSMEIEQAVEPVVARTVPQPPAIEPVEIAGVRRSTRTRAATTNYVPTMKGNRYAYAVTQLEAGALHPDLHMAFLQHMCDEAPDAVGAILTQLSMKAGLKEWGGDAEKAVTAEMKQLHFRNTFEPLHWHDITAEDKAKVLESHLFLKKKSNGTIKGRAVAGGNKQRDFITKEDASSPTVATESVLLMSVIAAEEGRDVAIIDIPNAFIQTRVEREEDMVIIQVRGYLVDVLCEIDPNYKKFVTYNKKGEKQLLLRCWNAIYGTIIASLLYYNKFVKTLHRNDFELNPYDPCIGNRMVEGKQQSCCFHVDDCMITHVDAKVNSKFIKTLREEYESLFEDGSGKMVVHRGKVHKYLGMTLDFTTPGQVKVTMFDYIKEILATFEKVAPMELGTKTSAAPKNLFTVNEDCEKLVAAKSEQFHHLVAKTLFVTKRARPNTGTVVSFLSTRVWGPDKDDWKKLVHLMKYLNGTRKLPLILSSKGTGILKWWVDGSFAVHPNMRGHTGVGLSMGRGFPITSSTKQKLNTRSSTESELVGVDDAMPAILWTRNFLEAQGYGVKESIIYQDNKSAILLEKNGKASSSKRTKHINIRYFFVTDRIKKGDISVEWCPTELMHGDFMTKPTQGALFTRTRDQIMGAVEPQMPEAGKAHKKGVKKTKESKTDGKVMVTSGQRRSSPQECVGRTRHTRVRVKPKGHASKRHAASGS